LVFLMLPLAVAVWVFGSYAAHRERNSADERLAGGLAAATGVYRNELASADQRAREIAGSRRVQRAFLARRPSVLHRIEHRYTNVGLLQGRSTSAIPSDAAVRRVDVVTAGRTIGQVAVFVPFDRGLVVELTRSAGLTHGQELAILRRRGATLVNGTKPAGTQPRPGRATDIRVGGANYRALAMSLKGRARIELVALERRSRIDAAASSTRWRVIGVGFGLIAALLGIAYALAPAIARSRFTRHQRAQAEQVLDHVGDGIFLVDRDGIVRLWNQAAEAITGLRADAVCNRPAHEAIPGWKSIADLVAVAGAPSDNKRAGAETVPLEIGGNELWLSIVGSALADGIVYAFRDVTLDRRLEEVRSEFVATISHELRTPLASVHGAALTLRQLGETLDAPTRGELLEMIAVQSSRLAGLIDEILVAGQLDSGGLPVVSESFDPGEIASGAAEATRLLIGDQRTIVVSMPPLLPNVKGSAERTRQVLTNLLDNAVKYSPHGGRIDLIVQVEGERVRFAVRDEGLGIPLGEQERIFDKFYRLDPEQRRGVGGTGLGLYICRGLVRSMQGRIWVESDPGEGSTFTFELPVAERVATPV
jgi:PAS domain S-box-containing protein